MTLFDNIYRNKRVLVTGHTGFKGSWLTFWLSELGAKVSGIALDPITNPNHWDLLNLSINDYRIDINDYSALKNIIASVRPELIFHLAAQPLVLESYRDPVTTFNTNIIGTVNVLEAGRNVDDLRAIVIATTDKCYDNKGWSWGYREIDPLGGRDPYSASKACTELVANSYRSSFYSDDAAPLIATVRSGNVIGGGDWSDHRLIPDLIKAAKTNKKILVRSPNSTRPWLHVLDSLSGYLIIGKKLIERDNEISGAWNLSPNPSNKNTVLNVLDIAKNKIPNFDWVLDKVQKQLEEKSLLLDSTKARLALGWRPLLDFSESINLSIDWYNSYYTDGSILTAKQIRYYTSLACSQNEVWTV